MSAADREGAGAAAAPAAWRARVGRYRRAGRRLRRAPGDALASRRHPLVEGYRRVYFFHLRKAGGTSLNRAFLSLGGEDPMAVHRPLLAPPHANRSGGYVFVAHDRALLQRGHYSYGWSHVPYDELDLPPRTFTLTVLRDPCTRVISLYRYLAGERPDMADGAPSPEEYAWVADGFTAFLDRVPEHQLLDQLRMFSTGYDVEQAARRVGSLSAWFAHEDYAAGLADLSARLARPLPLRWDRRSEVLEPPGAADLARLREMLEPEYALLDALAEAPGNRLGVRAGAPR